MVDFRRDDWRCEPDLLGCVRQTSEARTRALLEAQLQLNISAQPDETTCGPTCLHAVYDYYGDAISLEQVIDEVEKLDGGGTLAVFLACHALRRGYSATIYTYNLHVFDPTWFSNPDIDLQEKLRAQADAKRSPALRNAIRGYLEFLELGGLIKFEDLSPRVVREPLKKGRPIITGLSATYLYRDSREIGDTNVPDDVRGTPVGHFVVLCGYNREERQVMVADPMDPNPFSETHFYAEDLDRVLCSILLGIATHDANLLMIKDTRENAPKRKAPRKH